MFEKLREQRRLLVFFAAIYVVFGSAFFYLLFMTPGLEFTQEETGEGIKVFLLNDSSHIIHSIEVETDAGEKIASVERLMPQETSLLQLGEIEGVVRLVAKAPYHAAARKSFSFVGGNGLGREEINLSYKVTAPPLVFVDLNFVAEIEVCNRGEMLEEVSVEEKHGKTFFKEANAVETFSLDESECRKLHFALTPKRAGQTKIYFNVKALSYSKQVEKEITIQE